MPSQGFARCSTTTVVACRKMASVSPYAVLCFVWLPFGLGEDCVLNLPDGRCVSQTATNDAFSSGRMAAGLRWPRKDATDHNIGLLGSALEEASRFLARRYDLTRADVALLLPRINPSLTDIAAFCPAVFSSTRKCNPTRYRRHDGLCNNLENPTWGAALQAFRRLLPPDYADNVGAPRVSRSGRNLPNPRLVSAHMHRTGGPIDPRLNFMFVTWGQLLDHDLTLTAETKDPVTRSDPSCCSSASRGPGRSHPNCLPVEIPPNDHFYQNHEQSCMEVARSLAGVRADCRLGTRVQFNLLTSYIDANFVYGSSFRVTDSLRLLHGGLLRTEDLPAPYKPLLPSKTNTPEDGCIINPGNPQLCFLAGDNRVNEQIGLAVLHTVLVREHNRLAQDLAGVNPHWDDEHLFQETRHIVAALVQHISYVEFLPVLLGAKAMRKFGLKPLDKGFSTGYNTTWDATIPDSFATAAFRFGHSLLPDRVERWSRAHQIVGFIPLSQTLQRPFDLRHPGWMDQLILGMANQAANEMDDAVTGEVTNHLFQRPGNSFGRDLATINIVRAREHGVPGYNHFRQLCNLSRIRNWTEMAAATNNETALRFSELFEHPDDVDLWSAGVSEQPKRDSVVGPTFNCIIARTFRNLKRGDRFWYENKNGPSSFTPDQLKEIRKVRLSRLLCDAGDDIDTYQLRALQLPHPVKNPRVPCSNTSKLPRLNIGPWKDAPKT